MGVVPKALRCGRETGWGGVGVSERSIDLAVPDLWSYVVVVLVRRCEGERKSLANCNHIDVSHSRVKHLVNSLS